MLRVARGCPCPVSSAVSSIQSPPGCAVQGLHQLSMWTAQNSAGGGGGTRRKCEVPHRHCHLPLKLEAPAVASQGSCCLVPDVTLSHSHEGCSAVTSSHAREGHSWHFLCLSAFVFSPSQQGNAWGRSLLTVRRMSWGQSWSEPDSHPSGGDWRGLRVGRDFLIPRRPEHVTS